MNRPPHRAYRGASADERRQERHQRLLATALELFAHQGYAHTPIETLCTQARVTTRHFYQLFASREALLRDLFDELSAQLREAVLLAMSAPGLDRDGQMRQAVAALLTHYGSDTRRARVSLLEVVGVSAAMEQRRRAVVHGMAELIERWLLDTAARGELPQRDYALTSIALVGGIQELLTESLVRATAMPIERLGDEILFLFDAFIRGARPLQS